MNWKWTDIKLKINTNSLQIMNEHLNEWTSWHYHLWQKLENKYKICNNLCDLKIRLREEFNENLGFINSSLFFHWFACNQFSNMCHDW